VGCRRRSCWSLISAAVLVLALAPGAVAKGSRTTTYASAHTGLAYPVRSTAPSQGASLLATTSVSRGARRIPRGHANAAPSVPPPRAGGQPVAGAPPSLLANFNGVSSRDSGATNFGQEFEPPDQGLCAGNGYVVEMVNSAYTVYRPNGSVVTGPFNINGPFDEGLIEFTSDPRCMYDAATNTWYATILFINGDFTVSRIDLSVNTSGAPTKLWTTYQIDTTDIGGSTGPKHPGCPCLGDQPTLGLDSQNVYITTNEFSLLGPEFNGAQVYAVAKRDLGQPGLPSTPAHFVHFDRLNIGGAIATSIQPAILTGGAGAEYFLNSLDPTGTFDQRIGVWAMTNRGAVATGGKPTLSSVVIPSEAYGFPPGAEQKGTSTLIDSGDDRMQQTQFLNGEVWGELGTSLTIPGDTEARAGAAWFDVRPILTGSVISAAHILRQGYVAQKGNYVLYPALQATPSGKAAMVVSVTGSSQFPSAAYSVLPAGGSKFGPITVAAPGTARYDPNAGRWGDYSWAVLDPSGTSVWMATEYMPPKASQTPDGLRNWGTRVLDLSTG
jgi:hypothetical protein